MKKGLVITAVVLLVLGLMIAAGAFALAGFDFGKLGGIQLREAEYPFDADFTGIEIDTDETDIVFCPAGDAAGVVCEERDGVQYTVTVEDGTLKIGVDDRRTWTDRIALFSKKPTMTVCLPSERYDALCVVNRTGDVTIPEGFSFGSIDVTVSTGDVRCDASADEHMYIRTSTGSVTCGGCSDGLLRIETTTGDVRFDACDAGSIFVRTSTGDVSGTLRSEKIFRARTSTGDVDVPDTVSGGICEITTSTGDIRITLLGE